MVIYSSRRSSSVRNIGIFICHRVIIRVWQKVHWEDLSGYEEGEGSEGEHVERRTVLIIADVGLRRHVHKGLLDIHDRVLGQLKE